MKRRWIAVAVALVVGVIAMAGCGRDSGKSTPMTPEDALRAKADKLLRKKRLRKYQEAIRAMYLPAIGMTAERATSSLDVGASKVGGDPDVPVGFEWPKNGEREIDFLLQIDLSTCKDFEAGALLPSEGTLAFFYDVEDQPWGMDPTDKNRFACRYFPPGEGMQRRERSDEIEPLDEYTIHVMPMISLPHVTSTAFDELAERFDWSESQIERYDDVVLDVLLDHPARHSLLGYPYPEQNADMELEVQLAFHGIEPFDIQEGDEMKRANKLAEDADDWILLLELGTIDDRMMWGDVGSLYWWIRKQDLAERRFKNVWVILQCG
ncbi:DUF1963 domain-containing protein [bacterium]|nr:DUF1963 domain-containing protein [bacterium]